LRALDRLAEVGRGALEPRRPVPPLGFERERRALREWAERLARTAPEPHAVAGEREVGRRRKAAVARAQDGNLHRLASPSAAARTATLTGRLRSLGARRCARPRSPAACRAPGRGALRASAAAPPRAPSRRPP